MPDFTLPPAIDARPGLAIADLKDGTPKLLNIWASWCVPCIAEAPQLEALEEAGAQIVGVAIRDRPGECRGKFLKRLRQSVHPHRRGRSVRTAIEHRIVRRARNFRDRWRRGDPVPAYRRYPPRTRAGAARPAGGRRVRGPGCPHAHADGGSACRAGFHAARTARLSATGRSGAGGGGARVDAFAALSQMPEPVDRRQRCADGGRHASPGPRAYRGGGGTRSGPCLAGRTLRRLRQLRARGQPDDLAAIRGAAGPDPEWRGRSCGAGCGVPDPKTDPKDRAEDEAGAGNAA